MIMGTISNVRIQREAKIMNVLEVAIAMETDLEKHYLRQAEINKDNALNKIFTMLAKDEKEHGDILRKKSQQLNYELEASEALVESKTLFKDMEDFDLEIKDMPTQLDAVRMALEMEQKSIDAYKKLASETEDDKAKALFEFLVTQEKEHYDLLEGLVFHLARPEEWVEAAEFGERPPY